MATSIRPAAPAENFTQAWACDIINRASRILGPTLPGCSVRRYECPPESTIKEWIFMCFRTSGPVLPFLDIQPLKYFNGVQSCLCYKPMFLDSGLWDCFPGQRLPWDWKIEDGPEAVAERLRETLSTFDFTEMDRTATVEKLMEDPPPYPDQARDFKRGICAIYLRRYREAAALFEDYLAQFPGIDRSAYPRMLKAESYLERLNSEPESVRSGMSTIMSKNWSLLQPLN